MSALEACLALTTENVPFSPFWPMLRNSAPVTSKDRHFVVFTEMVTELEGMEGNILEMKSYQIDGVQDVRVIHNSSMC